MNTADRTAGLRAARAKDSADKRRRARETIAALEKAGTIITAAAVAARAGVSTWLVYSDEIREHLDAARHRQQHETSHRGAAADKPPPALGSLHTDLALAREQIRRLRDERDKLTHRLRPQLGAEVDELPNRNELIGRVAELESQVRQLLADRDARATEADRAQRRATEAEDDLIAARESLRRVIKEQNRPQP